MNKYLIALLAIAGFLTLPLQAQMDDDPFDFDGGSSDSVATEAQLLTEITTIAPGQSFKVALQLIHPEHWHSYYNNDGIGISVIPEISWTLPEGFKTSALSFPAPQQFLFSGMNTYGYEGIAYFTTTITAPADLKPGSTVNLSAAAAWQICDADGCLMEEQNFTVKLTVADTATANADYAPAAKFNQQYGPTSALPDDWKLVAKEVDGKVTLTINTALPSDVKFYEFDRQIDVQKDREVIQENETTTFSGHRDMGNDLGEAGPKLSSLRGIIYSKNDFQGSDRHAFWVDVPFEGASQESAIATEIVTGLKPEEPANLGVFVTLSLLVLGGLVLNLMPCVFPVIGLKIMGFVQQAGEDKRKIKLHGIAFTVGVLACFLALASFFYPIKAKTSLGSQLQEPWVVFSLLVIMLLLALSMAGLFEIGTKATSVGGKLAHKEGISGSFFSGVLAVVIATPCSAPFLGPAIGAAWKFDGPLFFIALLSMGVGLALPYITLSFFPALVNKLPRPGAWMESFKQGMSFLLFATVGYLVWIYSGQVGEEGQKGLAIMLGLTIISLASWVYGRWNTPMKAKKTRIIANSLAFLFFATGIVMSMPPKPEEEKTAEELANAIPPFEWGKWSPEKVEKLLAEGTPVYVDFTAKWCVTCQTNKATAYTDNVRQLFSEKGIVVLKADMTKKHPTATKAIHSLNRSAIPVNVLYVPGDKTPHVTREILTPGYMTDLVDKHLSE